MATPTLVVVLLVAVVSLVALALLVLLLIRRLVAVARDLRDLEQRLAPALQALQHDTEVTGRELERVSSSLQELTRDRGRSR